MRLISIMATCLILLPIVMTSLPHASASPQHGKIRYGILSGGNDGKCLAANPQSRQVYAAVCGDRNTLLWTVEENRFRTRDNQCLELEFKKFRQKGTPPLLNACGKGLHQQWRMHTGQLVNGGGLCLEMHSENNQTGALRTTDCNDPTLRQWRFKDRKLPPGAEPHPGKTNPRSQKPGITGRIVSEGGLCLELHSAGIIKQRGKIHVWTCRRARIQHWRYDKGRLENLAAPGFCLDVDGPDLHKDGGRIQLWPCNDGPNQQWRFDRNALRNTAGRCLDIHDRDLRKDGGHVQLWTCNGKINQQWYLVKGQGMPPHPKPQPDSLPEPGVKPAPPVWQEPGSGSRPGNNHTDWEKEKPHYEDWGDWQQEHRPDPGYAGGDKIRPPPNSVEGSGESVWNGDDWEQAHVDSDDVTERKRRLPGSKRDDSGIWNDRKQQEDGLRGRLISAGDLCVELTSFSDGAEPFMGQCLKRSEKQQWLYDKQHLFNSDGKCLSVSKREAQRNGAGVFLLECRGDRKSQSWQRDGNHFVNAYGLCLSVAAGQLQRMGGRLELAKCSHSPNQQWWIE